MCPRQLHWTCSRVSSHHPWSFPSFFGALKLNPRFEDLSMGSYDLSECPQFVDFLSSNSDKLATHGLPLH